jgi:hypothetical protein
VVKVKEMLLSPFIYFIRKKALAVIIHKCKGRYPLKISGKNSHFTPDAVTMHNYATV